MQLILVSTFGVIFLFYILAIVLLIVGISRLTKTSTLSIADAPTVSIIVSARNEAHNLSRLIRCLVNQNYPDDKLEICLVDDNSTDETWEILCQAEKAHANIRTIRMTDIEPGFAPKKRALDRGIRATTGDILLFTDADCTPPPSWVKSTVALYDKNTAVVVGYSPYRFDKPISSILQGMLTLEFFTVAAVAASSIGLKRPLTAAGCNLSYRRSTYFAVGGFESIKQWISGDDDLFVLKVAQEKIGAISYAISPEAFVPSAAPLTWQKFWNQRIRYASKGMHYELPMTFGLIAVYIFNVFLFFGSLSVLISPGTLGFFAISAWFTKAVMEFIFLSKATKAFQQKRLLRHFVLTQFLHPPYIILFGFLGLFNRFKWIDETFQKTTVEVKDNVFDSELKS